MFRRSSLGDPERAVAVAFDGEPLDVSEAKSVRSAQSRR
jgi:hypothetical protein